MTPVEEYAAAVARAKVLALRARRHARLAFGFAALSAVLAAVATVWALVAE